MSLVHLSSRALARRSRLVGLAWSTAALALATQVVALVPAAGQAPRAGELDTSFGGDGSVTTEVSPFNDGADALVVQPDGKLVAGGRADADDPEAQLDTDFALARYNPDGSLDTGFGGGGSVTTDFTGGLDEVHALVVQPDGKLVAAGEASQPFTLETGAPRDFALVRYTPDGSLDTTFGVGGRVRTDFGGPSDRVFALALQPDGKLVAAGDVSGAGLARYNPDGSLDPTFGTGGRLTGAATGGLYQANAVALQPDGRVVVAGYGYAMGTGGIMLARFDASGTLDSGFGTNGVVLAPYFWGPSEANALVVHPDGKLLVGGMAQAVWGRGVLPPDFALVRFLPNGLVDRTFGYLGWVITASDSFGNDDVVHSLVEQPDGRIVAAGTGVLRMARYTSTGALDTSFGNGGRVMYGSVSVEALARQTDGKLVTAGAGSSDTGTEPLYVDFAVTRYHAR